MKKIGALLVGLLFLTFAVLAGEVITNDTGKEATGLHVSFSTPVLITAFGDVLTSVDPQMLAFEFVFSGGVVEPWGSHWMNWAPSTAQVVDYEWLTSTSGGTSAGMNASDDVYVPSSYLAEVTFSIDLMSNLGVPMEAVITRKKSVETIPFWVEYTVDDPEDATEYQWVLYTPDYPAQYESGRSVRFFPKSNAKDLTLALRVVVNDISYRWEETLDFPLHNLTEITLDATAFYPDEEISVEWSAANGDPEDAVTFPITNASHAQAKLVSDWPNVLDIGCRVETSNGEVVENTIEFLIYFRDGTPFEIRSVGSTFHHPMQLWARNEVMEKEFDHLRDLGVNAITTSINWYFGPPDENGNWSIRPIWQRRDAWPHDPRGNTVLTEDLEELVTTAHEQGFFVHIQLIPQPYRNDPDIEWSRTTYEHTFRTTDEFLYGTGQGYQNMLLYYLDEFVRLGVEFVYLGAENAGVERNGGAKMRSFYSSIIQQYRDAGFAGGISYATNVAGEHFLEWFPRELLSPGAPDIPYDAMDAVAATFYPVLFEAPGVSTESLQQQVRRYIDEFFLPRSEAYDLPTIIEDCYCFAYGDCAMQPITHGDKPRETECSRRYHNAILREFSRENIESEEPWIQCITMAEYKIMADTYMRDFYQDGIVAYAWLNESAGRLDLQLTIKTFFSDKPIDED